MNYETTVMADGRENLSSDQSVAGVSASGKSTKRGLIISAILLGLVLLAAIAFYLLSDANSPATVVGESDEAPLITVVSPGRATIEGEIATTGTLAARRSLPVGVVGEGGRVVSVPVEAGQWVNAGQILAVIDRSVQNQQAASADAQVQVARADARLAQSNLDRALQLVDRGFISKADVDRLTATRDAASARVNVSLAQARELRARNARLNIVAPAGGLILERNIEPGQVVSSGSGVLFLIARGGEMELLAKVGEADLANLSVGTQAQVTPVGGEKIFTGQVWQIAPVIDQTNRQGTARIALPYSAELRPGGFASAVIKSGTIVAPILPESAILSDEDGSYVYIVDQANKVVRRPVETGLITAQGIAIAKGLTGTEKVVLRAGGFLNPGEVVEPKMTQTADLPKTTSEG